MSDFNKIQLMEDPILIIYFTPLLMQLLASIMLSVSRFNLILWGLFWKFFDLFRLYASQVIMCPLKFKYIQKGQRYTQFPKFSYSIFQ